MFDQSPARSCCRNRPRCGPAAAAVSSEDRVRGCAAEKFSVCYKILVFATKTQVDSSQKNFSVLECVRVRGVSGDVLESHRYPPGSNPWTP